MIPIEDLTDATLAIHDTDKDSAGDRDGSYRDNAGDNQGDDHNGASGVQCENPAVAGVSVGGDHDNAVSIFTANMVTLPYSPTLPSPPGIKIARDISQYYEIQITK